MIRAGVIAGTPVDTGFGLDFLKTINIQGLGEYISKTPEEQNNLQVNNKEKLEILCLKKCLKLQGSGARFILIFCNSLSSAINVDKIKSELKIPLFTPFDFYQNIANKFDSFGVVAANATGLLGIEGFINKNNQSAKIINYANLEIVKQIEKGKAPKSIINDYGLADFMHICSTSKVEVLLLGCTHYSYLFKELLKVKKSKSYNFLIQDIDHGLIDLITKVMG